MSVVLDGSVSTHQLCVYVCYRTTEGGQLQTYQGNLCFQFIRNSSVLIERKARDQNLLEKLITGK